MANLVGMLSSLFDAARQLQAAVDTVQANHAQCRAINDRVQAMMPQLQAMRDEEQQRVARKEEAESAAVRQSRSAQMQRLEAALTDALEFVREFTDVHWLRRFIGHADDSAEFSRLNLEVSQCQSDLGFSLLVAAQASADRDATAAKEDQADLARRMDLALQANTNASRFQRISMAELQLSGQPLSTRGSEQRWKTSWLKRTVSVKILSGLSDLAMASCLSEATFLSTISHQRILPLLAVALDAADPQRVGLVTDWMDGGSLLKHVRNESLTGRQRYELAIDCALVVAHLHEQTPPVVHGAIQSANFFLDMDRSIRAYPCFSDGGSSLRYRAPELLRGRRVLSPATDVFALSVLLHEIFSASKPFSEDPDAVVRARVLRGERMPLPSIWTSELRALLTAAWAPASADRPTSRHVAQQLQSILLALNTPAGTSLMLLLAPQHAHTTESLTQLFAPFGKLALLNAVVWKAPQAPQPVVTPAPVASAAPVVAKSTAAKVVVFINFVDFGAWVAFRLLGGAIQGGTFSEPRGAPEPTFDKYQARIRTLQTAHRKAQFAQGDKSACCAIM